MMKVIFMGTPDFAAPTFKVLHESNDIKIERVYTKPPKPAGRGKKETKSVIHTLADTYGYEVHTPKTLKNIEQSSLPKVDAIIVVAYGLLLRRNFLDHAPAINLHPSDLPKWRGAAPMVWSVLAGDETSAICTMHMDEGMDTGDVIMRQPIAIDDKTNMKSYAMQCANIGAGLIIKTLNTLKKDGKLEKHKQNHELATHARKIEKSDVKINWNQPARLVQRQVMAFSPKPGAYFIHKDEEIKILDSCFYEAEHSAQPGSVVSNDLEIACIGGFIKPLLLKRSGRKEIYRDAFLRGYTIKKGEILS